MMHKVNNLNTIEIAKRRKASLLILTIYSTQLTLVALINNLYLLSGNVRVLLIFYYVLALLSSIPQSGLSDECGRKKHLLIASVSVLVSISLFLLIVLIHPILKLSLNNLSVSMIALIPCIIIGVAGNVVPIARGCLCALHLHDFRSTVGVSTVVIGLSWITVNLLSLILSNVGVIIFSLIFQVIIVILIKTNYNITEELEKTSFRKVFIHSYKWLWSMFLIPGGLAALLAYLLSDTSFYVPYIVEELPGVNIGRKITGVLMGIGYMFGVIIQWIIFPTDKKCIKIGIVISLISIIMYSIFVYIESAGHATHVNGKILLNIYGLIKFSFATGFGFFVPALFSLMSNHLDKSHFGKLFGVIDTMDTLALALSSIIIVVRNSLDKNNLVALGFSLILFIISLIMYVILLKKFSSYEIKSKKRKGK